MEQKELDGLKKKIGSHDAGFSLYSDLFKIIKNRLFLALLLGGACFAAYQIYTFAEKIRDPTTNQDKIIFLKYSYGKPFLFITQCVCNPIAFYL